MQTITLALYARVKECSDELSWLHEHVEDLTENYEPGQVTFAELTGRWAIRKNDADVLLNKVLEDNVRVLLREQDCDCPMCTSQDEADSEASV